jgi:hypothetical protein
VLINNIVILCRVSMLELFSAVVMAEVVGFSCKGSLDVFIAVSET